MKKLLSLCAALLLAFGTMSAFAADLTGVWVGEMKGPDGGGGFQLKFDLKQDGAKLTGTVQGPQGEAMPITNGKVDGDKFSFDVSFNGMTISHEGTVTGDEMKMKTHTDSGDFPGGDLTLKRTPKDAGKDAGASGQGAGTNHPQ